MTDADGMASLQALAAHLRDPARAPSPPGLEPRRVAIYRDLVFNNIEGFLRVFFPVLHSLYPADAWRALVRDFIAGHRCESPYFLEIAEEFLRYLEQGRGVVAGDPPFLHALAHYEWLELALDVAEEEIPGAPAVDPDGDLLVQAPVVSPLAVLHASHWPVHRIGPDHRPAAPLAEPVFLIVYRDRADQVRFMELNALAAGLFMRLREQSGVAGREILAALAAGTGHPDPAALAGEALVLLEAWRARDIIAGTCAPAPSA